MVKRGPKSAAELMISEGSNTYASRPDAPYTLTDEEADEWRAIVGVMHPNYFARSHYPMLSQLCRHVVASNRVAQLIDKVCKQKRLNQPEMAALLALQASESNSIIKLCRQLRLSHQALYRGESVKSRPIQTIDAPWSRTTENFGDDDDDKDD